MSDVHSEFNTCQFRHSCRINEAEMKLCQDLIDEVVTITGAENRLQAVVFVKNMVASIQGTTPSQLNAAYDPEFGDDTICACGHVYYRHFDSYEKMLPVGCKYCDCTQWRKP